MLHDPTLIGTVQNVNGATVSIELTTETATGLSFVDGEGYRIGQVGSFVRIPLGYVNLYGVVSQVGAGSAPVREEELNPFGRRWLTVQLVGEGRGSGQFVRGLSQHPTIDDRVHLVTEADLKAIYGPGDRADFVQVGNLASAESIPAYVDITKLITRHSAIVGTTGSGKSNTVAGVLQALANKTDYPSARILVLDIHGEYGRAFKSHASLFRIDADATKAESPLVIPYWALRFDEFMSLAFGELGEKPTAIVSEMILKMKRDAATTIGIQGMSSQAITVDSPIPFSIHKLWFDLHVKDHHTIIPRPGAAAEEVDVAYVLDTQGMPVERGDAKSLRAPQYRTVKSSGPPAERVHWGKNPLGIRAQLAALVAKLRDPRFSFIFNPGDWTPQPDGSVGKDLDCLLESWIGGPQPITVLDLSGSPPEVLNKLIGALLRVLYDAMFWARNRSEGGRERPLLLVLEEAHSYLGEEQDGTAAMAVKRIAKEGRKYGVGLMLVSQRPSEIDSTILSQCGTIFAMRLANNTDRAHVTGAASDNLKGLFDMLPVLRTGEAIIVGEAVSLPIRSLIDRLPEDCRPDSDDPRVVDRMIPESVNCLTSYNVPEGPGGWNRKQEKSDYAGVVEQMRRQDPHYKHPKQVETHPATAPNEGAN